MKDRVPTEVLENGAVRMEQFDASGNSLGYIYLKRADAPKESGTPYSKNAVLTDTTATAVGLNAADNPTPNDAFAKIATRIKGLDDAGERLAILEENTYFPDGVSFFAVSGTFTAPRDGRYRITCIGGGGGGGNGSYSSSSQNKEHGGGGGGSGGIAVGIIKLSADQTLNISISAGVAAVSPYLTAGKGGNGGNGTARGSGAGGAGGSAEAQLSGAKLYPGNSGHNGSAFKDVTTAEDARARGGDAPYFFGGNLAAGKYANDGKGLFADYLFGFGGAGGLRSANMSADGREGGPAGVVIEYMGDGDATSGGSSDPSPDIYAQLLELAESTEQIAQSVRDDADAGKFDGAPGAKGDKGDTGDPGSDYVLTDADKSEIAALVLAQIPDGDEVAYG